MNIRPGLLRSLARIEALTAPFEEYACAADMSKPADRIELFQILEIEGMFTPALMAEIHTLGVSIHHGLTETAEKLDQRGKTQREFRRAMNRFNQKFAGLCQRRLGNQRPLASAMVIESQAVCAIEGITETLKCEGVRSFDRIISQLKQDGDLDRFANYLDWFLAAHLLGHNSIGQDRLPAGLDNASAYEILREIELEACPLTPCGHMPWNVEGRLLEVSVFVPENIDPLVIAGFRATTRDQRFQLHWALSRVSAELVTGGYVLIPISRAFEYFQNRYAYHEVVRASIRFLINGLLNGSLKELAYIPTRITEPAPLPSIQEVELPAPETEPEISATEQDLPLKEDEPTLEIPAPARAPESQGERLAELHRGRLTWRRIMSALKRCGVYIEYGGKHPRLRLGNKSSAFLNPHSQDTKKNQYVLWQTLKQLGIDRQTFIAAL